MAQDKVGLFNLALSAIGTRSIVSLESENSREAEICNLWFNTVRDQVLRAAPWSSARTIARLALLVQRDFNVDWAEGDPEPPWIFSYAQPQDLLYPRHIDSFAQFQLGLRRTTLLNVVTSTPCIYTNAENALFVYTFRQEQMNYWDVDLYAAVAYGLSAAIAMALHGKASRAKTSFDSANDIIMQARVNSANESHIQFDHVPDWLSARGVGTSAQPSSFIFPNGPLLSPASFVSPTTP